MKKTNYLILFTILFLPVMVFAHPGGLDSNGCHYCRTNCEKWGLSTNQYHCHNGSNRKEYYLPSQDSNNNNSNINNQQNGGNTSNNNENINYETSQKSSVNTIKKITINDEEISIANEMNYTTSKEIADIKIELEDNKATYTIEGNKNIVIGDNFFNIKVTAENGSSKEYNLNIKRLSNNTNIKIQIDTKNIEFNNDIATISVEADVEKVNYTYQLEDEKSKVDVNEVKKLEYGENKLIFTVTAEDGTVKKYSVIIIREEKENPESEEGNGFLGLITIIGIAGAIAYVKKKN